MAITHYSEKTFAIDLIGEAYHTSDPVTIVETVKEILDMVVTVSEVIDYLSMTEDFEKESNAVTMKSFFDEGVLYE